MSLLSMENVSLAWEKTVSSLHIKAPRAHLGIFPAFEGF